MSDMQGAAGGPGNEEAGRLVGGRYRLVEPIGRGARSRIWHGRDEAEDRDVAIEDFRLAPTGKRRELLDRMAAKARKVARIDHPGIADVLEVIEESDGLAVVTEFYPDSTTLEEAAQTPLPVEEATRIAAALLDALHTAHSAEIVHGSLNPRSVLLAGDRVVITDFVSSVLPNVPGRFLCPAPEVLEGRTVTPASDMWSLGVILYQAVEGHSPFDGPTLSHVLYKMIIAEKIPARRAGALAPLLDALLVKDQTLRPTAADAARYL